MALFINGQEISKLLINGQEVDTFNLLGEEVFTSHVAGSVTIYRDSYEFEGNGDGTVTFSDDGIGSFTPPQQNVECTICIVGGGGSGSVDARNEGQNTNRSYTGGGFAGDIVEMTRILDNTLSYEFSIGLGGESVSSREEQVSGKQGESSFFDGIEALGGLGGTAYESCTSDVNYAGEGQDRTTCLGTAPDGEVIRASGFDCGLKGFGGQSSGLDRGGSGNASRNNSLDPAEDGGVASGGGGCSTLSYGELVATSGAGGSGVIKISW